METGLLVLLAVIPSVPALVDCRAACHQCHNEARQPEVMQVYCEMCEECKSKRRERAAPAAKKKLRLGITEKPGIADGCPSQPPCSDEEDESPIEKLTLKTTLPTTKTTTKATTKATTKRPCPSLKPRCRKKTPPMQPPPPPPLVPMPVPPMPMPPPCCAGYPSVVYNMPPVPQVIPPYYMPPPPIPYRAPIDQYIPEFQERTPEIVVIGSNEKLKASTKDFMYMYVGVPKGVMKS